MADSEQRCPEILAEWPFPRCNKEIKRDGYCGIHARMHEKRIEGERAWKEEQQKRKQNEITNTAWVTKLEQEFGIDLSWCVAGLDTDDPHADMSLEDLEQILRKASGKEAS